MNKALKKRIKAIILFLFLFVVGKAMPLATDTVNDRIQIRGDSDYPPYEFINKKGEAVGFNVDLIKALMKELNLTYELKLENWSKAMGKVENGDADIISGIIYSHGRDHKMQMSIAHSSITHGMVVRKGAPEYLSINALKNKNVIVQRGEIMDDYLTNTLKFSNITRVDDPEDGFKMLKRGDGDVMLCSNTLSMYILKHGDYAGLEVRMLKDMQPFKYCIGVSNNNDTLLSMINDAMYRLKQNGEYDRIYDKWFGVYETRKVSGIILTVLVVLVALLFISFIIIILVRRKVRNAVAEVKQLNAELELSLKAGEISVWKIDLNTNIYLPIYGSSKSDVPQSVENLFKKLSDSDRQLCNELFEKFRTGAIDKYSKVFKYKDPDNEAELYTQSEMVIEYDNNGKPAFVIGTLKDVTGIYYNNSIIKSKLKGLDMAMGLTKLVAWRYMLNTKRHEMLYGDEKMLLSPFAEVNMDTVHPDDRQHLAQYFDSCKAAEGEENNAMVVRVKSDLKYYYYEIVISKIIDDKTDVVGYVGCMKDITVSFELKEKYIYALNMAMNAAQIAISDYDIYENKFYLLQEGEFVESINSRKQMLDTIHEEDVHIYNEAKRRIISRESDVENMVLRIKDNPNAEYRYYEMSMSAIVGKSGQVKQIVASRKDINDRILHEQEVTEIRRRTDLAVRSSGLVQWEYDCESDTIIVLGEKYSYKGNISPEKYVESYVHEDYKASVMGSFQRMRERVDKEYSVNIKVLYGSDNEWHYVNVSGTSVKDYKNRVVRYSGFVRDDTKLIQLNEELKSANREMQESNSFLNNILDRVPCSMFIKDVDDGFRNIMANEEFALFHKKQLSEILGKTDSEIVGNELATTFQAEDELAVANNGETFVVDKTMPWKDDIITWRLTEALFTTPDGHRYIIGLIVDISERERYRAELEIARQRAEESNRLKSAFLANMSHEIRTPLNAIVGFSEMLITSDNEEEKQQYINVIYDNNELLLRLIGDVLDLSKIESGSIELSMDKFDFARMFNMCATSLRRQVINPEVEFIVDSPYSTCEVVLDEKRIMQVITNFVTNAVKFTLHGHIKIGYKYDGTYIYMYCEDTGSGIPENKIGRIFERFFKVNEFAQGTGLGMAICKAIADGMNAEIGVYSTLGKGSIFYFKVPCNAEIKQDAEVVELVEEDKHAIKEDNNANKSLKILVAEDIDSNFMLVKSILRGYDVSRAVDGEQAVQMAKAENYGVILMDMKMPKLGGLEATEAIRKFNKKVCIIALTANAFDSDRTNALEAGCNDFLAKPIKRSQLIDAIEKQLKL